MLVGGSIWFPGIYPPQVDFDIASEPTGLNLVDFKVLPKKK